MATVLNIVYGSTTINLASGTNYLMGYTPVTQGDDKDQVSEAATVLITAATTAALQTAIEGIEQALRYAKQYQDRNIGDQVFINIQLDGEANVWRSEVIDGRIDYNESTLDFAYWPSEKVMATIVWTRRNYWEGSLTSVPLTNSNGTNLTTGINVYNCNDLSGSSPNRRCNYVDIASTGVTGNLLTPAKIEMTNSINDSYYDSVFYISHNVLSAPASFTHTLEAEAANGASSTSDSSCSGGYRYSVAVPSGAESTLMNWNLSSSLLNYAAGNYFKVIARGANFPDWFRLKITYSTTAFTIWSGPLMAAASGLSLQDFGTLQLPPSLPKSSSLSGLLLVLSGKMNSGSGTCNLDFLQLGPLDGYRKIYSLGYGVMYNETLIDDGTEKALYVRTSGGYDRGTFAAQGKPIMLEPGKAQRLYFLKHYYSGAPITRYMSVKVSFRPRRRSL